MKIETIAVTNVPTLKGVVDLKKSLIKYGIPNQIIVTPWQGFYTKVNEAYKYAKECNSEYLLFVDAHDVIFVGGMDEIERKIKLFPEHDAIFSSEKACWPDGSIANQYPETDSQWKYLNSGTYLFKPQKLIDAVESNPPTIGIDDQLYWTKHFLNEKNRIILDTNCEIFQTLAHDNGDSFGIIDGKFTNKVTGTNPLIAHGNGRAFDEFDYSYLIA